VYPGLFTVSGTASLGPALSVDSTGTLEAH
jgi:hypothetical protein